MQTKRTGNDLIVTIALDDPVEMAAYALMNNALEHPLFCCAIEVGYKVDVVYHVKNGRVIRYGPFVQQVP